MSIQSPADLRGLTEAGRIVRLALDEMRRHVRPGITTAQLDELAERVLRDNNARSAPAVELGFPGIACISVNDEAVHGIPGDRVLREGDLVKLDVTVEKDGYVADAARTVAVEPVSDRRRRLLACARAAFYRGIAVARAGKRVNEIGRAVESHVRSSGFSVIRQLTGHGVGRAIHEEPSVPNYYDPDASERLSEGLVITIEPIIAEGSGAIVEDRDGWTIRTKDRGASAHYEQTIVITRGRPLLLTGS